MDDIEQKNKKHLNPKSGRKFQENKKVKLTESNKVDYKDSRGQKFIKTKKDVNKVNAKAFAIQNINKAKKKVSYVVDKQTAKHTFRTLSSQYTDAPQLICLVGPQNSGKSTLLRTLMRHYTGHRITINGPVTVVTSKKKRATFLECPNDLHSMIDVAKTADMILLMINVKQGIQTETFEFMEILSTHGVPRVKIIFTHLDEFNKNDTNMQKKIKLITKRIQMEIHALTFRLSEFKTFRTPGNSEYKIEEVRNLARLIGQKNPLPNEWRQNHPYIVVDRLEKVTKDKVNLDKDDFDEIKFYGYVRGCTLSSDIAHMHLMGVGDLVVNSIVPLPEPCPTPQQESNLPKKRQPLEIKERKAYAPMSGYGGVLKDSDGFHIVSDSNWTTKEVCKTKINQSSDEDEENLDSKEKIYKSNLIMDMDESDESDENDSDPNNDETSEISDNDLKGKFTEESKDISEPSTKKQRLTDTENLISGFEDLENELKTENNRINYERLIYDEEYACDLSALDKLQNDNKELSLDLFVTGKWDENEDASTLLKKDNETRQKIANGKKSNDEDEGSESEEIDDESDDDEMLSGDVDSHEEMEVDDESEEEEMIEDDEEYEEDSEMENKDDSDNISEDENSTQEAKKKSSDLFDGLVEDTATLTDFQKKRIEKESKTKREKKLEKKAKHKALFDNLYDQKQGDKAKNNFFDQWKEANDEQEEKNKVAFEHLDNTEAYKITGLKPGSYVCVWIKKVSSLFFDNFNTKTPIILGGLCPGEEKPEMLTASFKLSRHFEIKQVLKTDDPVCFSLGWRRIQSYCTFFKEEDNLENRYLKYSEKKGLYCKVAFFAPAVPVKTGFTAFINFEHHEKFRLTAIGSVLSNNESVIIKKRVKRVGAPVQIFKKTAFIEGMFKSALEVINNSASLLKTTSGIRGAIKKPLRDDLHGPGAFRATFEAPIFMSDIVYLTGSFPVQMLTGYHVIQNLLVKKDEVFPYWIFWNQYRMENNIPLPNQNTDSNYKKIERKPFVAAPIKFNKKLIDKLPFKNRPLEDTPEDRFQKSRPKMILSAEESKKAQLVDSLLHAKEERRKKLIDGKQKFSNKKAKQMKEGAEKELIKKKMKTKAFFKNKSIKSGEAKRKRPHNDE